MAYTDTWNAGFNTAPAGSGQLSGGDDAIRQSRLAVFERLSTLVNDINVDPLTLKASVAGAIGTKAGKKMIIPAQDFMASTETRVYSIFGKRLEVATTITNEAPFYAPVILAPGVVIQTVEFLWNKRDSADITGILRKVDFDVGVAEAVLATVVEAAVGIKLSVSGAIAHTVLDTAYYYLEINGTTVNGLYDFYGARITYDASDSTETL